MTRAQPKLSPTDQHARRIAAATAKGRPPMLMPDLEAYFDSSPREIFAAFEGAARHMPPAGKDEGLAPVRLTSSKPDELEQRAIFLPRDFVLADRLMQLLACMRMICDTPAILDPTCRISPKLEELEGILGDLLQEPDRKIIVFSEWERMLELVRELAAEMGIEAAWHTGSVPQQRRRAEIVRFKQDPTCRLFLSTNSGSVGLNLQVASAVVNVDLPWNPAKLEQRIARAWRKNQTRSVTVVHLVCEDSIEDQILHLLGHKQALADGVLDGQGDLGALKMPSGRAAMIERLQAMMNAQAAAPRILSPEEMVVDDLRRRHGERLLLVEARSGAGGDGRTRLLAVLDLGREALAAEAKRHEGQRELGLSVEIGREKPEPPRPDNRRQPHLAKGRDVGRYRQARVACYRIGFDASGPHQR